MLNIDSELHLCKQSALVCALMRCTSLLTNYMVSAWLHLPTSFLCKYCHATSVIFLTWQPATLCGH